MKEIKYGIWGCGKHTLHSHAIPGRGDAEIKLTTICDISKDQLDSFERVYGETLVKCTKPDVFLNSDIGAIFIGTPDEFHYQNLISVIKAGKHVFVEKPLAVNSSEVQGLQKLLDLAASKGLVVSSCHPRRYDPPFMWLKENLSQLKADLGEPLEFKFDFSYHQPSKDWKRNRGLLLDHANHEVDLMHHLFGHEKFEAIKFSDSFDHYHVVGQRKDGIKFSFSGTRRLESRNYLEFVYVRFTRGDVVLDAHQGKVRINNHNKSLEEVIIRPTDYESRGRATMINFARAIKGTENCYLSAEDLYVNTAMSVFLTEQRSWKYENN